MTSWIKRWMTGIVLWGYDLLYHSFAWIYDFAAWLVSAGRWNDWIREAGKFVQSGPVLDLGCGKGILLQQMAARRIQGIGLDESPQMLRYSRLTLQGDRVPLVRGIGQSLPFAGGSLRFITATFPANYIFENATLQEIHRLLQPEGRLIILLTAIVTGPSFHEHLIRLFARPFGFDAIPQEAQNQLFERFNSNGLDASLQWVDVDQSRLLFLFMQQK